MRPTRQEAERDAYLDWLETQPFEDEDGNPMPWPEESDEDYGLTS